MNRGGLLSLWIHAHSVSEIQFVIELRSMLAQSTLSVFFGLPPGNSLGFIPLSGLRPYCQDPPEDSLRALKRCGKRKQDEWRRACDEAATKADQRSRQNRPKRDPPPVGSRVIVTWDDEGEFDCLVIRDVTTGFLHVSHPTWDETVPFDPDEDEWRSFEHCR